MNNLGLAPADEIAGYETLTAADLLALEIPPKEWLLEDLIRERELAQVYGPRGLGKTWLSLSLAWAVASGTPLLSWRAPEPRPVLYVDGEMDLLDMRSRVARLAEESGDSARGAGLHILSAAHVDGGIGDMADEEVRDRIDRTAERVGAALVVVDNLSCLYSVTDENSAADFNTFNGWILSQRRAGRSVLVVHHAGKSGQQRGTSRREDSLDLVLALKQRPDDGLDDVPRSGCRFDLVFEKARGLTGKAVESISVSHGPSGWSWEPAKADLSRRAVELYGAGLKQRDIAAELGVSLGKANKLLSRAGINVRTCSRQREQA